MRGDLLLVRYMIIIAGVGGQKGMVGEWILGVGFWGGELKGDPNLAHPAARRFGHPCRRFADFDTL